MPNTVRFFMSVGRDYSMGMPYGRYEYVIWRQEGNDDDGAIVARDGGFRSSQSAKRAGFKVATELQESIA